MSVMMEGLLTPKEAAEFLKLSEYTVKDMLRSGIIRGVKSGNRWRVRPEDLRNYINNQDNKKA